MKHILSLVHGEDSVPSGEILVDDAHPEAEGFVALVVREQGVRLTPRAARSLADALLSTANRVEEAEKA